MTFDVTDSEADDDFRDDATAAACLRCGEPFGAQRFTVRIEADPPISDPVEMRICEPCMKSMARWTNREGPPKASRKRRQRRNRYTEELDRNESSVRRQAWLIVGGAFLAAIGASAALVAWLVKR